MDFNKKVVLVTGSSRSIGREIALGFAQNGAHVVINYNKSEKLALELEETINNKWNKCMVIKADVGNINDVRTMFDKIIKEFGRIDVLVNNAAIFEDSVVWKMSSEVWENVIRSDLTSVFNCIKHATKYMRQQEYGRIINVSSVVGHTGSFGTSNYSAAKAGIFGITKAVAREVARKNITVNALTLGFIETGMLLKVPEEIQAVILKQIPIGRWGKPKEVVDTAIFLASEEASYITGQIIDVNGGFYM